MTDTVRTDAPGQFADLPEGKIHYQWLGADKGPIILCVHGLTTPSFVWGPVAAGLGKMGYRVLTLDLYGRGYSDRPKGLQDGAFYQAQINALLGHLQVNDPITLLGYSMGGAIVADYAAHHPDRITQVAMIAPAGMKLDLGPTVRLVQNTGPLGRWFFWAFYGRSLWRATEEERNQNSAIPDIVDMQQAQITYHGFVPSVYQSLVGILGHSMDREHKIIAGNATPMLAIWGADDDIIPLSGKNQLSEWNPSAKHVVVKNAGHNLTFTHVDQVLKALKKL